jgi:hypothetical protein
MEFLVVKLNPLCQSVNKKLQGVKLCMVMMCIREDAKGLAKRYSVVSNVMKLKRFKHLNSPYYTQKGIVAIHPKFKIVLERPNYFPGEVRFSTTVHFF